MDSAKYIGLDVHKESISITVLNAAGKIVMECVIETKAITILQFLRGLRGDLYVTFEEGTSAAWLYDLIQPHVTQIVVCNPRQNALLNHGNKSDRIDARKLAELLRGSQLKPVYHGEHGVRALKELVRSYLTISKDLARVMTKVKALYYYQQLDALRSLRQQSSPAEGGCAPQERRDLGELLLKPLVLHLPNHPSLLAFAAHVLSVRHYADHFGLTGRVQQGDLLGRDPGIFGAVDDKHRRIRFA
jgi:transposase